MWFKYFNKEDWNLRLWKSYNLKFEANVYGSSRTMHFAKLHSFLFRVFRGEGVLRYIVFVGGWATVTCYLKLSEESRAKSSLKAEKEIQEMVQRETEQFKLNQRLNKYNKPTMPIYSMDKFMDFVTNPTAIVTAIEFMSSEDLPKLADDQAKGLDSWLPRSERQLLEFATGEPKKKHH